MTQDQAATPEEARSAGSSAADDAEDLAVRWRKKNPAAPSPGTSAGPAPYGTEARTDAGMEEAQTSDMNTTVAETNETDWYARFLEEQTRAEEYLGKWQRTAADVSNIRRRHEQDRQEYTRQANAGLIADLLQVLDSYDYALAAMPEDVREQSWAAGMVQIERQLRAVLERAGLTSIEALGTPFDPNVHEALGQEESDQPEDTVVGEFQRGYKLYDRVLRPARVKVAVSH